jgi:hypothetical protein
VGKSQIEDKLPRNTTAAGVLYVFNHISNTKLNLSDGRPLFQSQVAILLRFIAEKEQALPACDPFKSSQGRPPHTMLLLQISKNSLYGFFSLCINPFVFFCMAKVVSLFHTFSPNMTTNTLHCFFTLCTLCPERIGLTDFRIRAIHFITSTVRCFVRQYGICRT